MTQKEKVTWLFGCTRCKRTFESEKENPRCPNRACKAKAVKVK